MAAHLVFFAVRAWHVLTYPYPLDYGEGPLLAQVQQLMAGTPLPRLYNDPGAAPYLVVNYPPVYLVTAHILATLIALLAPDGPNAALLAGRLISLFATLGCVLALWRLASPPREPERRQRPWPVLIVTPALLAIPVVREWAALMRVDLLGVCLGLWGLVLARRGLRRAALLLALGLLVKPSLIAAPAAALAWLWFRDRRRALELALSIAALGGAAAGALHLASGGWFWFHAISANANPWSATLAEGFWQDQYAILWPLWSGAALAAVALLVQARKRDAAPAGMTPAPHEHAQGAAYGLLPVYYTCAGAFVAFGVGKVGAYANYFFEYYAGMIWLITTLACSTYRPGIGSQCSVSGRRIRVLTAHVALLLLAGALLRYYPLWSENYVKPYGLIEGENPPRLAFGSYGVWRDLQRERDILDTLTRVNGVLVAEVRATRAPLFTDFPGIAAQAGVPARLQVFEHRQLYDAGLWDQRPLLRDLAGGAIPLVVLDYLGNWLTPEMITIITHRYAQDGSRGTFDLYRPVDPGPRTSVSFDAGAGLLITGVHLAAPAGTAYSPGERVVLTLELQRAAAAPDHPCDTTTCQVVARLATGDGKALVTWERPLLYGVLPPGDWGDLPVQHMQALDLPPELLPGAYRLTVAITAGGAELAPARVVAPLAVGAPEGRLLGERGYFVPAPLFATWVAEGGYDGPGDPLMPAVPFADGVLQCFARTCLRLADGSVTRLPLGETVLLGDAGLRPAPPEAGAERLFPETGYALRGAFLGAWEEQGGAAILGPPITAELRRGTTTLQYTRYARLERSNGGTMVRPANLGEEYLRLPGIPYRWQ